MTSLLDLRVFFTGLVPGLLDEAFKLGYDVTLGEVVRSQAAADWNAAHGLGTSTSLHLVGLAVDLNLFQAGKYLLDGTGHTDLGPWWERQSHLCAWGGRFTTKDFNHYSITFQGRR